MPRNHLITILTTKNKTRGLVLRIKSLFQFCLTINLLGLSRPFVKVVLGIATHLQNHIITRRIWDSKLIPPLRKCTWSYPSSSQHVLPWQALSLTIPLSLPECHISEIIHSNLSSLNGMSKYKQGHQRERILI